MQKNLLENETLRKAKIINSIFGIDYLEIGTVTEDLNSLILKWELVDILKYNNNLNINSDYFYFNGNEFCSCNRKELMEWISYEKEKINKIFAECKEKYKDEYKELFKSL